MDNTNTGMNGTWLIFLLFFFWIIIGGFGGGYGASRVAAAECGVTSNCQVEKQTIINTATTQNLIQTEGEKTRQQATNLYIADQSEKLFDAKMSAQTTAILNGQALAAKDAEIAQLKAERYADMRFNELARGQERISCEMLKEPKLYGRAFTCSGTNVPNDCF